MSENLGVKSLTTGNKDLRNEWRRKGWVIPDLRGGKSNYFLLVKTLVILINENEINDLDAVPSISMIDQIYTWRMYIPFLKGIGLVINKTGSLYLSDDGLKFLNNPTESQLATIIHSKIKLFGEVLNFIALQPMTVEEVNKMVCDEYQLNWSDLNRIRKRMDWLEVLGMIKAIGNRKWQITSEGENLLEKLDLIFLIILKTILMV